MEKHKFNSDTTDMIHCKRKLYHATKHALCTYGDIYGEPVPKVEFLGGLVLEL